MPDTRFSELLLIRKSRRCATLRYKTVTRIARGIRVIETRANRSVDRAARPSEQDNPLQRITQ